MAQARLEHVNFTVVDPHATAAELSAIFGWRIRWEGEAINGGYTIHLGEDDTYVAIYRSNQPVAQSLEDTYKTRGGMNHLGVVVDDLDATEAKVCAAGLTTGNHGDYEPGRRFYFDNSDGIEIEVVSYA